MKTPICAKFFGLSLFYCRISAIRNCAFENTVNITSSERFANGSYIYEGVLVPPELTDHYDYIELFNGERRPVMSHIRGCVCHLKPCVKFCCHPRSSLERETEDSETTCSEELSEELLFSPRVNITLQNSSQVMMHLLDGFVVQQGIPCGDGYMLMPHKFEEDEWELLENGTLLHTYGQTLHSRRDYCLQAYEVDGKHVLNPLICPTPYKMPLPLMLSSIVMAISAPFLYATVLIYWLIPELWNLHTKCLICYLLSLAIGTTLMVTLNLLDLVYPDVVCAIIGFVSYYCHTAVFFWLNVICFDLWHNFRSTSRKVHRLAQRKRFYYYSLYAWGMPALMAILTILLQYSDIPNNLKPGIGDLHCCLKLDDWSAMIYFYGPCLLLIIFNVAIFYLTAKRIYSLHKMQRKYSQGERSRRHLHSQQFNLWLFFRMFIIMGIGWLLEIVGYMVGNKIESDIFFAIADIYNASHGLIMFVLLVMKKHVLRLIKRRVLCIEEPEPTVSAEPPYFEEGITLHALQQIHNLPPTPMM